MRDNNVCCNINEMNNTEDQLKSVVTEEELRDFNVFVRNKVKSRFGSDNCRLAYLVLPAC